MTNNMIFARLLILLLFAVSIAGCATVDFDVSKAPSYALTDTDTTRLGVTVREALDQHPGESGFLLQTDGLDALATRILLAARAERSIDLQYYLISPDVTSRLLIGALLAAADRGVRVRLLLDDVFTTGYDEGMMALDSHPNFEVRLFNPFVRRDARWLDGLTGFSRVNRRMHNKSFTVDNQVTIIGGRNVGAEYFAAREDMNFGDLDVVAVGPVAKDVSGMFDRYWNDELAVPVSAVADPLEDPAARLDVLRADVSNALDEVQETAYAGALSRNIDDVIALDSGDFSWSSWELVYDDPEKARTDEQADAAASIRVPLKASLEQATDSVLIVSPYFVPNKTLLEGLQRYRDRGVNITVVTNSLSATNHDVVHSGYGPSRKKMLRMGVEIWEVMASQLISGTDEAGVASASGALHTKGFIVDRKELFLGSFNWDPRSAYINTESGIILRSEQIAGDALDAGLQRLPEVAYRVVLTEQGDLAWVDESGEAPVVHTKEPETTWGTRFKVGFFRLLPIKGQL